MRAIIQRVSQASVSVDNKLINSISNGLVVLIGMKTGDTTVEADFIAEKIVNMRLFCDENDKINLSVLDIHGKILLISNFTVYGNAQKGRRPSFDLAMGYKQSQELYEYILNKLNSLNVETLGGIFGGDMKVNILNDGPVTVILDSKE